MDECHKNVEIQRLLKQEINIKKGFIKTLENFEKILFEVYQKNLDQFDEIISFTIVKNYLSSTEFSKILSNNIPRFLSLTYINMTANDLTGIPIEFLKLEKLETLILNNNKIKKIENLNNLIELKRLELRSNRITKIENLKNLSNLKLITLSCNLITNISNDDIGELENLEEIGLFGNFLGIENKDGILEIEEKNKEILKTFLNSLSIKSPKIKKIYLGGNHFSKINNYKSLIIQDLANLEYLDGNKI